jgi:hypothetical protein
LKQQTHGWWYICSWEKAFDCVHHDVLLSKLKFYGVTEETSLLFKLYVEDGHKRVIFNDQYANCNTYCDWGKTKRCVPQGSLIHGPLLFFTLHSWPTKKSQIIHSK